MKNKFISGLLLCVIAGTIGASPVDLMIGARGFAFGGAYVSIADDPSAAYWNPAGLSQIKGISLMESNWILQNVEGLNVNYVSLAIPVKYVGTVSGSWLLMHATLEEGWDENANAPVNKNSANEQIFTLSIGRALVEKFLIFIRPSLGFSINRHTFTTAAGNGAGLGFDLGLFTEFPYGFRFGFTARTLATEVMGEKIDPELRFGVGYRSVIKEMHRVTVSVDGSYKKNRDYVDIVTFEPAEHNMRAYGGLEYALLIKDFEVAIRGGINAGLYNSPDTYGVAGGLGIKFLGYAVDYAFKGDTDADVTLGYSHRISLIIDFNNLKKTK